MPILVSWKDFSTGLIKESSLKLMRVSVSLAMLFLLAS